MKEQGLVVHDQVLVEREAAGTFDNHGRVDSIDPVGNLMDICPGLLVCDGHQNL
jgi:hypothetical protein